MKTENTMSLFNTLQALAREDIEVSFGPIFNKQIYIELRKWVGGDFFKIRMALYRHEESEDAAIELINKMHHELLTKIKNHK